MLRDPAQEPPSSALCGVCLFGFQPQSKKKRHNITTDICRGPTIQQDGSTRDCTYQNCRNARIRGTCLG